MPGPPAVVPAPPAAAPRVGLLVSARQPTDEDDRWVGGFRYDPELCGTGYITSVCNPSASDRDLSAQPTDADWEPYVVGAGIQCSTFGFRARDWQAQARRALEAVAEFQISVELWTGTQATAEGLPNRHLADVAAVDILTETGPVGLTHGLACLEQYLSETIGGRRGMIHATRQTVTHWQGLDLIRREGNLLLTVHDTIVVPGAGYDGSTPDGAAAADGDVWAYATDIVDVRRAAAEIIGGPDATGVDRDVNTTEIRAEQPAVASWEGCAHGGVRLDITVCGIGGS